MVSFDGLNSGVTLDLSQVDSNYDATASSNGQRLPMSMEQKVFLALMTIRLRVIRVAIFSMAEKVLIFRNWRRSRLNLWWCWCR